MTRAINVRATEAEVAASCRKQGAVISAIEPLTSGGTRVVLTSMAGADTMRRVFAKKLLVGTVERVPLRSRGW